MRRPDQGPTVSVIGPGRVGTALAVALRDSGYAIVGVAGRGRADVERFIRALPTAEPLNLKEAARWAGLILVTVSDDQLQAVARDVAVADGVPEGSRWVHTSGRYGAAVLRPVALAGGRVAACHPAQTFPTPELGRAALPGCAWAVTAAAGERPWAHGLVHALKGHPVDVGEEARVRYHAGLVVGANGTTAVVTLARDLLLSAGIAEPERFLASLAVHAASNAADRGAAALTGPVRRGDADTVAAHLHELQTALPEAIPAYRALADLALAYARRAGLDDGRAAAIRHILDAAQR